MNAPSPAAELPNFAEMQFRRLYGNESGSVVTTFAIVLPVLILIVGLAIDFAIISNQKSRLQSAADAAAIAVASEFNVASAYDGIDEEKFAAVARTSAAANLKGGDDFNVRVKVDDTGSTVEVQLTQDKQEVFFGGEYFIKGKMTASSKAQSFGSIPLCVLGLGDHLLGTITLEQRATLTGNQCAVYSNSTKPTSIISKGGVLVQSGLTCSAGGYLGSKSNFDPHPLTDCPVLDDPLALRPPPAIGSCTEKNLMIGTNSRLLKGSLGNTVVLGVESVDEIVPPSDSSKSDDPQSGKTNKSDYVTLYPGVYCGGLIIGGNAYVELRPGTYIIKDGPLHVSGSATIEGEHVGFYLTGQKAVFFFGPNTNVTLTAPKDGPLAGLLFYEDRKSSSLRQFSIFSDNARVLEGTIYVPKGYLYIDADRPIADKSAYTAIISQRLALYAGPHLVLNTDYDQTDVPVPEGIKGIGHSVRLVE